jgi:hypothetical protein
MNIEYFGHFDWQVVPGVSGEYCHYFPGQADHSHLMRLILYVSAHWLEFTFGVDRDHSVLSYLKNYITSFRTYSFEDFFVPV